MATFTNRATLSYNGRTVDSNTVTGTFLQTLTVTKTPLTGTYTAGETVTYTVSLVNAGATPLTGLTLTDDLGAFDYLGTPVYPLTLVPDAILYYVDGVLQPTPTVASTQPLVVQGMSVPAGGDAVIVYQAVVSDAAPLEIGGEITNTATVSGGGLIDPLSDDATVSVENAPFLTINKALSPVTVPENGTLTYTFTIQNYGNTAAVATDDVIVNDTFDPVLDILSVTLNGVALTEGAGYTYNPVTGEFATAAGTITVPAATFTRAPDGTVLVTPGEATLVVVGTI